MFNEVRDWNREHIREYVEIFIDAPKKVLMDRDKKGVYKGETWFEYPSHPDLKLLNDGTTSIKELVKMIEMYKPASEDDFDRDKEYWNRFLRT